MIKHCNSCGKQLHREAKANVCEVCIKQRQASTCDFCKETNCPAWGSAYFKSINKRIYVDFRADMEFNQIDCQFGILDEFGVSDIGEWSDFAININFCPVCGRKLPPVE